MEFRRVPFRSWEKDGNEGGRPDSLVEARAVSGSDSADRIYVMTPQARVIELPSGATPVDFAYYLHTDLGHRCRGARVDGQLVPLLTKLETGHDRKAVV